jgi:cyclohexyl-isocyanide hydratase
LLLGAAGLLTGRRATTHWAYRALLPRLGATLAGERVVRDGCCVTSGGVSAGIDAALSIVSATYGESESERIRLAIEYLSRASAAADMTAARSDEVLRELTAWYEPSVTRMSTAVESAAVELQRS